VLDVSALVDIVDRFPVYLIGHSLGAAIVLQYAGVYPDRVAKLVAIDGFGPLPEKLVPRPAHQRLRQWIETMRSYEQRQSRRYPSIQAAVSRMQQANPYLTEEMARHLTLFGSNWSPDGSLSWKFDNYVRAFSPYGFNMEDAQEIWGQITCPALLVRGMESWSVDPVKDGRIRAIANYRLLHIPRAGHWAHHDQPQTFIDETRRFFREG